MRKLILITLLASCSMIPSYAHGAEPASTYVTSHAEKQGVPVKLALAVAKIETGVQCGRVGKRGERGPLQIHPRSAAGLGYPNIAKSSCDRQTEAGMAHLAYCFRNARGNTRLAVACHNQGFGVLRTGRISRGAAKYAHLVLR
jgi:soluble lytic murein transglycosylase-like protein